jgi:hypothetical protein
MAAEIPQDGVHGTPYMKFFTNNAEPGWRLQADS